MRNLNLQQLAALDASLMLYQQAGMGRVAVRPSWITAAASLEGQTVALDDRGIESLRNIIKQEIAHRLTEGRRKELQAA